MGTGIDKMSMERQLGEQGRKMVKERSHFSGEERSTDMFKGMTEDDCGAFNARWEQEAAPHLPQHSMPSRLALGHGNSHSTGYSGGGGRRALPMTAQDRFDSEAAALEDDRYADGGRSIPVRHERDIQSNVQSFPTRREGEDQHIPVRRSERGFGGYPQQDHRRRAH